MPLQVKPFDCRLSFKNLESIRIPDYISTLALFTTLAIIEYNKQYELIELSVERKSKTLFKNVAMCTLELCICCSKIHETI